MIGGWDTVMDTTETKEDAAEEESIGQEEVMPKEEPWKQLKVGDEVLHKSFGIGQVVSLDDNYIFVKFKDRESKFLFPSVFEKEYLSYKN